MNVLTNSKASRCESSKSVQKKSSRENELTNKKADESLKSRGITNDTPAPRERPTPNSKIAHLRKPPNTQKSLLSEVVVRKQISFKAC
jgi:hypothetical protein